MRIVWSPLAITRVSKAADYIAADNPAAAQRWVDEVFEAVSRFSKNPEIGRVVPETQRTEIRGILFGVYRIIYRIETSRLIVLTVRHGRRLLDISEVIGTP
jgi:toxin ParE1/3/4